MSSLVRPLLDRNAMAGGVSCTMLDELSILDGDQTLAAFATNLAHDSLLFWLFPDIFWIGYALTL